VEDPFAVLECVGDAAVGRAAHDLVRDVEAHPDDELEGEMRPPAWEAPGCVRDDTRHGRSILTRLPAIGIPLCGSGETKRPTRSAHLIDLP
jgi:hypothetical protein